MGTLALNCLIDAACDCARGIEFQAFLPAGLPVRD